MNTPSQIGALTGLRVLDLSDRFGYYAGKLFADMGADVILVEKPGGCAQRFLPPFLGDRVDPALGVAFNYFNANKRGLMLDLANAADRGAFLRLAASADLVIEDFAPGRSRELGIDYASLAAIAPKLVMTSITPFGQTGPYAKYAADDLTLLALGGFLNMMGYPDVAPTQAYGEQAIAIGAMFAAVGTMVALHAADAEGPGQHVDVSIQEAVTMALENAAQTYDLEGRVRARFAGTQRHAGTGVFECSDGHVYLFAGGMGASRFWGNLVAWLTEHDVPGSEVLTSPPWNDTRYLDTDEAKTIFNGIFPAFARARSKDALYHEGQSRRVPICPVNDVAAVAASRQLAHRGFFASVFHPMLGKDIVMPSNPFRMSVTPGRVRRAAPRLDEHRREIRAELDAASPPVVASARHAAAR
jgi:benzylsuccinate CoA-transferase BbsE subunit